MTWQISLTVDGGACGLGRGEAMHAVWKSSRERESLFWSQVESSSLLMWLSSVLKSSLGLHATNTQSARKIHQNLSVGLSQTTSVSAVWILKLLYGRHKVFCFPPSMSKVSLCTYPAPGEFNPQTCSRIPQGTYACPAAAALPGS